MTAHRHLALLFSLLWSFLSYAIADHSFENTAIVRTIELGGSLVHVRTTFAVRALETGSMIYAFALGKEEAAKTSFMEARFKSQVEPLELQAFGFNSQTNTYLYAAMLPKGLKKNENITLELETVQTHATYPWPVAVAQNEEMSLKYEADLLVLSPYYTVIQRTKIRTPSPKINSFTEPKGLDAFTLEAPATKSGATITYGPYSNVPISATLDFTTGTQQRVTVHYKHDFPMLEMTKLKRAAEISHWGANLNIQDEIWLRNAGPELRGHFSRLEHQQQAYFNRYPGHIIRAVSLHLPAGVRDVYFYDLIGNVSTSHLRETPSVPKGAKAKVSSLLELKPRYPLMGGWNYSFTLGWDSPLRDSAAYDSKTGRNVVAVPIMTQFPDCVVNEAEVTVILPEGAIDLEVYPPFPPLTTKTSTHKTYLDTKGRPAITFYYGNLTDRHVGVIYVAYKVPFLAHLRKPLTIASVFFGLFMLASALRRVDMKIRVKKY